jgi:hypothetical protein
MSEEEQANILFKLSQMDPQDIAESEEGAALLAALPGPEVRDCDSLLRPWASIRRASAAPLSDAEYRRFLEGKDPYGAD